MAFRRPDVMLELRVCVNTNCGQVYPAYNSQQRYCSMYCNNATYMRQRYARMSVEQRQQAYKNKKARLLAKSSQLVRA